MTLNERAMMLADEIAARADELNAVVSTVGGARIIDLGVAAAGGLQAGLALATASMSGLGAVAIVPGQIGPSILATTDHPVRACLASQYAGWQINVAKFFAMGSGPMRSAYGKEPLFDVIGFREQPGCAVGVLETRKLPDEAVIAFLIERLGLPSNRITLLVAPTASLAGGVQVVARSVETALHKLHEIGFDVRTVVSGAGTAPLPPPASDDLAAIGRTNDAIIYGGDVHLWCRTEDESIVSVGPKTPSQASPSFGRLFIDLFKDGQFDFYKLDKHLFAPAAVTFHNLNSGRTFAFGQTAGEIVARSFGSAT